MIDKWFLVVWGLFVAYDSLAGGAPGSPGTIVYDPINHVETAMTAANSVRQTAQQVQGYLLQVQQYLMEAQNIANLPQAVLSQTFTPLGNDMANAQTLADVLNTTQNQLSGLQQSFNQQIREMTYMGLSPSQYLDRQLQIAQAQGQGVSGALANSVNQMQAINLNLGKVQALQGQISGSSGLQQSLQVVNEHLNLLAGQNAQLMGLIASHQAVIAAQWQTNQSNDQTAGQLLVQQQADMNSKVQLLHQDLQQHEIGQGWGVLAQ